METNLITEYLMLTLNWKVLVGLSLTNKVELSTGGLEPPQLNHGKYYIFYYFLTYPPQHKMNFHDRERDKLVSVAQCTPSVRTC